MADLNKDAQRELDIMLQTREVHEDIAALIRKTKKEWVDSKGKALDAERATEEWRNVYKDIHSQLKGSIKNVQKLGEETSGVVDHAMKLAQAYKLSAQQAAEVAKKAAQIEQRENARKTLKEMGKGKILEAAKWLVAGATAASAFEKNLKEVYRAQELVLSAHAATGESGDKAWKDLAGYSKQYRDVTRNAATMAGRWGVSTEEARQAQDSLFDSLAGQLKDVGQYGAVVNRMTNSLMGYARMSGQTVPEAHEDLQRSMRAEGKTWVQALADQNRGIAGYNKLAKSVHAAAWPTRKEYFQALKDVRHELGPVRVNVSAVTAAMGEFAAASSKAGGSAENVKQAMAALPKLLTGLPRYFKVKIGEGYVNALKPGHKEHAAFIKRLQDEDPTGALTKRIKAIKAIGGTAFQQAEAAEELLRGTGIGMEASMKQWQQMIKGEGGAAMAIAQMQQAGLNFGQIQDAMAVIKGGSVDKMKEAAKRIEKEKDAVKKESLPERLKENADAQGRTAIAANELAKKIEALKDANIGLIAAIGAAATVGKGIYDITKTVLAAGGLKSSLAALTGGVGGTAGSLGKLGGMAVKAGGALSALAVGYEVGTMLDNWLGLSDKISNLMVSTEKRLSEMKRGKERGQEFRAAQDARVAQTRARVQKYGSTQITVGSKHMEATADNVRQKEMLFLAHELKQKTITQSQFNDMVKALDDSLKGFPKSKPNSPGAANPVNAVDPRSQSAKITDQQKAEDRRWAPPPQVASRVSPEALAPDVKPLSQTATQTQQQTSAQPAKPSQLRYDPTTRQLTIIRMDDPALVQAGVDFLNSVKQQKR
jgi:hypothetical protein